LTDSRWLSGRKEIAEYLGVTGRSVTRMWKKFRDFPVKVVDGKFTVSTADLDAWMRKRSHLCAHCGQEVVIAAP
jgi:hypothetical protein